MGRPPKRQRASEGKRTPKHVKRNGKTYDYIEYSFVTSPEAFSMTDEQIRAELEKTEQGVLPRPSSV